MRYRDSRGILLGVLGDGVPRSCRELVRLSGLGFRQVENALFRCWCGGFVLRTASAIYEFESVNLGKRGRVTHTRPYHLYVVPQGLDVVVFSGRCFVGYSREYLDSRGKGGVESKSGRVSGFLSGNPGEAFYSTSIAAKLVGFGVCVRDVMANARRWERKGLVYIRGYKTDERQTPFREGYILTWIDADKPRELAIEEAVARTDRVLDGAFSSSPMMSRVNRIRDIVLEHTRLKSLVGYTYVEDQLGCSHGQAEGALRRALQLYPSIKEIKLFGAYRYFYHASMNEEELAAAVEVKRNTLRFEKGRDNRIGHNWEAAADWFIDKFTAGAKFWTQNHRVGGMDSRRITIHLIKGVGGRRNAAELDRVWEVNPSIFAEPITYVLSCKWGLVNKRHVDDFLEVLRWSKDFGVDTPNGRETKQGVVGVFSASAFNPTEKVNVHGTFMGLAKYAALRRLQLITGADFNEKLHEKGAPKMVTVQKVCRLAKNEAEVRTTIDALWREPEKGQDILLQLRNQNEELYKFEEMLEGKELESKPDTDDDSEGVTVLTG